MLDERLISTDERYFYVQNIDGQSGLALSEFYCGLSSIGEFEVILRIEPGKFNKREMYRLDERSSKSIRDKFKISCKSGFYLVSWSPQDGLPYRLHPNRELVLMLSGQKPLTMMSEIISSSGEFDKVPEHLFEPHVNAGTILKLEYCEPNIGGAAFLKGMRIVLYALAHEAWRLDAYIMVRSVARKLGWGESLTRLEGALLGYEEWQNDAYIAQMNRSKSAQ